MSNAATASPGINTSDGSGRPRHRGRRALVWAVSVVVIGGMLIAVLLPSLCRSREPANRVKCQSNLKQIGQAISLYARQNGGHYPASFAVLMADAELTPEVFTCPSAAEERSDAATPAGVIADIAAAEARTPNHKNCLSYRYAGAGLTAQTASETAVVAYEPMSNHDGDVIDVLFGDGHVDSLGKEAWVRAAAAGGVKVDDAEMSKLVRAGR